MRIRSTESAGFTIVEVLVVSVIAAVLAAIAIPVYNGYVAAQKQTVVENLAQTAATAANIMTRRGGPDLDLTCGNTSDCVNLLKIFVSDQDAYIIVIADKRVTVTDASDRSIFKGIDFE